MSALRLPGPDGRTILVPIDDGVTPYRSGGYIGGSMVTEAPPRPRILAAVNQRGRERMKAYKEARRREECGKLFRTREGICARTPGHADACASRAALDQMLRRRRAFSIHPENRR